MSSFKIETLDHYKNRLPEVIELISQEFNYPANQSFLTDFYPLLCPQNHKNCHVIIKNDEIIGHIGIKIRKFGLNNFSIPVALIGGIAIKKNYQGQGIFKEFFGKILNQYENDVGLFILWSDKVALYNKFNFFECGETIQTSTKEFDPLLFKNFYKTSLHKLSKKQLAEIVALHKVAYKNDLTITRSDSDWSELKEVTSCDLFIEEINGTIINYFMKGKGKDLENIVHESSFNESIALKDCQAWVSTAHNDVFQSSEIIYTSLLKVSNFEILNKLLSHLTKNKLQILNMNQNHITFKFNEQKIEHAHIDFLQLIFGPGKAEELSNLIPPYFVTGLDSV